MARLESSSHDADVACAVKGVVAAAVGHLDELLDDGLVLEVIWIHEMGGAKLFGPRLLARVDVDGDDFASHVDYGALHDRQADAAGAKDGHARPWFDLCDDAGGAVARGDAAAQQAGGVHGGLGLDGDDGYVGDDGVLGKGRCAHEVEEVLALALEAAGAVGHDALALRGPDLATEVGLARHAELALFALGSAGGLGEQQASWGDGEEGKRRHTRERQRGRRASRW